MIKISFATLLFITVLKTGSCPAQDNGFKNLSKSVIQEKLYDFGYGLEFAEKRTDSIVCFNDFMSPDLLFEDGKNLNFSNNGQQFTIKPIIKTGKLLQINILSGKKSVSELKINDTLSDNYLIAKNYRIQFKNKNYSVLYLSDEYLHQTFRVQFLGILIDEKTKNIIAFPRLQNTTSLLNLTDIDNDGQLDLVTYNPAFSGKVEVFSLEANRWKQRNEYTCQLTATDNFVWQIDFSRP